MDEEFVENVVKQGLKPLATTVIDVWEENVKLDQLCRACAKTSETFIKIFEDEGAVHRLDLKINEHLPIKVSEEDKLPKNMCYTCASTLIAFSDLVNTCIESEKKLNSLLCKRYDLKKTFESNDDQCSDTHSVNNDLLGDDDSYDAPLQTDDQNAVEILPLDVPPITKPNVVDNEELSLDVNIEQDVNMDENTNPLEISSAPSDLLQPDPAIPSTSRAFVNETTLVKESEASRCSSSPIKTTVLREACVSECNLNVSTNPDRPIDDVALLCLPCDLWFSNRLNLDEHVMHKHVKIEINSPTNYVSDGSETSCNAEIQCASCTQEISCGCALDTQKSQDSTDVLRCRCSMNSGNGLLQADDSLDRVNLNKSNNSVCKKRTGLYICAICDMKFKRKTFLLEHCRKLHSADKDYIKAYCESKGKKTIAIEKNVSCSYCNKRYVRKSDLVRHQQNKHLEESKKAKIVKTIDHMDAEVLKTAEMEVDGSVIYHCKLCKKNIVTKRGYIRHVRIHTGERPFTCHICGKQYRSSADLSRHLRSVHDGIKNFSCDICGRCFANKGTRNDHRRIHTGERPYVCDICGKAFPTANSIYVHRRIHTDYFPYQCTSCEKRFRRRQQLVHHIRTHTGEKPHACNICGKCFGVKDELSRHIRTHSLDKPFACSECGLCFGQKRYLNKHIRAQHSVPIDVMS